MTKLLCAALLDGIERLVVCFAVCVLVVGLAIPSVVSRGIAVAVTATVTKC
jgi:hypothetical protein